MNTLRAIHHANLVRFTGLCLDEEGFCFYLLEECCDKGSLVDLMANESVALDDAFKNSFIKDAIEVSIFAPFFDGRKLVEPFSKIWNIPPPPPTVRAWHICTVEWLDPTDFSAQNVAWSIANLCWRLTITESHRYESLYSFFLFFLLILEFFGDFGMILWLFSLFFSVFFIFFGFFSFIFFFFLTTVSRPDWFFGAENIGPSGQAVQRLLMESARIAARSYADQRKSGNVVTQCLAVTVIFLTRVSPGTEWFLQVFSSEWSKVVYNLLIFLKLDFGFLFWIPEKKREI